MSLYWAKMAKLARNGTLGGLFGSLSFMIYN